MDAASVAQLQTRPRVLLVDDSEALCYALRKAFERRGYEVGCTHSAETVESVFRSLQPHYVVLDLRLPGASGLAAIAQLRAIDPKVVIVVVTGYSSIATAVEAIKLGAIHYLVKPADASAIEAAFKRDKGDPSVVARETPLSVDRLAWEHIQTVLSEQGGNISAAARTLGMHRRTLQRKLNKRPVAK